MIMGVYDRLISSISSFFKEPAGSMAFLFKFVLGAGTGMVLFSRFISYLFTTRADVPLRFFFLGAVAGGVPMIYREAGVKKLDLGAVAYPVIGILGVVLLALIPSGLFTPELCIRDRIWTLSPWQLPATYSTSEEPRWGLFLGRPWLY